MFIRNHLKKSVSVGVSMLMASAALAQEPVVDISDREIVHFGVVVKSVEETSQRWSKLFGIPAWTYLDVDENQFDKVILQNKPLDGQEPHLRIGNTLAMGIQFELLEPVSGQGTHAEYLRKRGESLHHISINPVAIEDHDAMVAAYALAGIGIAMQGELGKATTFTYFDMEKDLGQLFEIYKFDPAIQSTLPTPTEYEFDGLGLLDGSNLKFSQVGLVVADAREVARQYEKLMGIGGWTFTDFLDAEPGSDAATVATVQHQSIELELIQPKPKAGYHRAFLNRYGNALHHIGFKAVNGYAPDIAELAKHLSEQTDIGFQVRSIPVGEQDVTYLAPYDEAYSILFEIIAGE